MKILLIGDTIIDHLFAINGGFDFIQFENTGLSKVQNNELILNKRPIINDMMQLIKIIN